MTAYELIGRLAVFPPETEVIICPQKRGKWNKKDWQKASYTFREPDIIQRDKSDEVTILIAGVSKK